MESKPLKQEHVILVCEGPKCSDCKCKKIYKGLKNEVKSRNIKGRVRIVKVDCLGNCKNAPNVAVLPENMLYSRVKPKEVGAILDAALAEPIGV